MRLLIIGKLTGHLSTASQMAFDQGAKVSHVGSIEEALKNIRAGQSADLIMSELGVDIAELVRCLKSERISIPIVACGVKPDPKGSAEAIRAGAQEFIPLPPEPDLIAAILQAVSHVKEEFLFRDPAMTNTVKLVNQIAPSDASILITGESGTGKEVMARYIHRISQRKDRPFISLNCAAIPENLLESELFGHEKGAFTGAVARRIGKFEEAHGGTLLLDEISEMDPRLQAKLLRAIQEREIDRVGGSKPIKIDIRLLATSNRNLEEEVKEGRFREDLYFRLNVVSIHLPPLRERPLDLELLSDYFNDKYSHVNGTKVRPFSQGARDRLRQSDWRGNVRELENTIHRAILLSHGDHIEENAIQHTGSHAKASPPENETHDGEDSAPLGDKPSSSRTMIGCTVAEVEKDLILGTLTHCFGNRTHAANILGISIRTLRNKLRQYTSDGATVPSSTEGATYAKKSTQAYQKQNGKS